MSFPKIKLTGELIEAFAGTFLSARYDDPCITPDFHREAWSLYASDVKSAGTVAPRDHAKTTALTYDYVLAEVCWRCSSYVILIGSTEVKAQEFLSNIIEELRDNEDLRQEFFIRDFEVDQKTEIIIRCSDGHRFRILARGAEQKIRGAMWSGKRPDLIVCDDMEDDEQVENQDRRKKFRKWFFRAAKQALSKKGKIRVHGTILHEDSLLARLVKNKTWKILFYKAHQSYSDFSNILWPERWSEQDLREKQREFEEDGDPDGYAQEMLNDPQDKVNAYLKSDQFLEMEEEDFDIEKLFYVGCDFAVSKQDHANRTSFTVGGKTANPFLYIVDERVDRWDTLEWIIEMLQIEQEYSPQIWFVEGGVIWNSIKPMIYQEMFDSERSPAVRKIVGGGDIILNIEVLNPVKDKGVRGRSFQKRMKAHSMKFNTESEWFSGYKEECLKFTGIAQARLDDQFDSTATLCLGLDKMNSLEEGDFEEQDPIEQEEMEYMHLQQGSGFGRSVQTGY